MKYIFVKTREGAHLPILFPESLVHAHMAGVIQLAIGASQSGPDQNYLERQLQARLEESKYTDYGAPPTSAGFVQITSALVHGFSESLDLRPAPQDEARIVLGHSVSHIPDPIVATAYEMYLRSKQ